MKKLTKVLSLVLVIAMALSLCVVGASAETFTDDSSINANYAEAVDVMSGVGIIAGMGDGTFAPNGNFTRAQAAKIIAYMQLGVDGAAALKGTSSAFTDVNASDWFAPYVSYCANMGIINGYGNGKFGPNDTLTGYQFAKMLLCAVGYGVNGEYTGDGWQIAVAKDALTKGVYDNVLSASTNAVITREQATQMAFNTLTDVVVVTYSSLYGDYIAAASTANGVTNGYTLADKVYALYCTSKIDPETVAYSSVAKSLVVPTADGVATIDVDVTSAGREGYVWYQVVGVNKVVAVSDFYFTDSVIATVSNGKQLTNSGEGWTDVTTGNTNFVCALDSAISTTTDFYYNGAVDVGAANVIAAAAKNGAEISFIDEDGDGDADSVYALEKTVATVSAKPTSVVGADTKTYVTIPGTTITSVESSKVVGFDGIAKGDVVLYYLNLSNNVYYVEKAATVEGTKTGTVVAGAVSGITFGGTNYYDSGLDGATSGASLANNVAAVIYLDNAGYVVKAIAKEVVMDVAVVVELGEITGGTGIGDTDTFQAKLLHTDGTTEVVSVGKYTASATTSTIVSGTPGTGEIAWSAVKTAISGQFVEYVLDSTTNKYTVQLATADAAYTSTNGTSATITQKANYTGSAVADSTTIFLVANGTTPETYSVYTGVANQPGFTSASYVALNSATTGVAKIVYVSAGSAQTTPNVVYFTQAAAYQTVAAVANVNPAYRVYGAIVDGKETTVKVLETLTSGTVGTGLYAVSYNADGYISAVASAASADGVHASLTGTTEAANNTVIIDNQAFTYNDNSVVIYINNTTGAVINTTTASAIATDANDTATVVTNVVNGVDTEVITIAYIRVV